MIQRGWSRGRVSLSFQRNLRTVESGCLSSCVQSPNRQAGWRSLWAHQAPAHLSSADLQIVDMVYDAAWAHIVNNDPFRDTTGAQGGASREGSRTRSGLRRFRHAPQRGLAQHLRTLGDLGVAKGQRLSEATGELKAANPIQEVAPRRFIGLARFSQNATSWRWRNRPLDNTLPSHE